MPTSVAYDEAAEVGPESDRKFIGPRTDVSRWAEMRLSFRLVGIVVRSCFVVCGLVSGKKVRLGYIF